VRLSAAALVAAAVFPQQADAQGRLSLAERVERLERQQPQADTSMQNIELLNQIGELQREIQSLRGLIEQQGFEIESMKKRGRDQYLDLDSRIARLGGAGENGSPIGAASEGDADGIGFEPIEDAGSDLQMEPPEVREPIDAGTDTQMLGDVDPADVLVTEADPAQERPLYDSAFDALKEGRYAESARRFQTFLNSYPNGSYAPNAWYWLGESYYVTQNYEIALESFNQLLASFPSSAKAPDALLKVGYCQYELRQWDEAESTLNQVMQSYPDTTVARLAQGRLRALRLEGRQ
jgi:tol-pal system protein YbgF